MLIVMTACLGVVVLSRVHGAESRASTGVDDAAGGQTYQGVPGSRPEGKLFAFR